MNDRAQIGNNQAVLKEMLAGIPALISSGLFDAAMQQLHAAGNFAWLNSCSQLASVEIEELITQLSAKLPATESPPSAKTGAQVATVLTSIHSAGGHSRLAWRWIQLDKNRRHHVILTNQGVSPLPAQLLALVETGRVTLTRLDDEPSLWARAMRLRQFAQSVETVVLHIHPDDPIAPVALAKAPATRPVILVDHASHVFWMGACAANLVLTLHGEATRITTTRRGVPSDQVSWWPLALDTTRLDSPPASSIREELNIPPQAVTLLTSGWPYKFHEIEGLGFCKAVAPVLAARPDVYLMAVGPNAADPVWQDLLSSFPDRIHLLGVQEEQRMVACYKACDIYLESIPFPSGTATAEAAALGKPIIKFSTQEMRDCGFSVDFDSIPMPAYNWSDLASYRNNLLDLIDMSADQRATLGKIIRASVRNWHNEEAALFFLEKAYRQAGQCERIRIDPVLTQPRFDPLDRLLIALGENYRSWLNLNPARPVSKLNDRLKLLAFYLPQFHEIPENNAWWGEGFTEWTNVRQAKPLFEGHQQPLVPGEMGYYDLSSVEVMERQALLAKKHGIHGFCFHYYWFDGQRLLEKPVDQLLMAKHIDLPFCLCWANENWTRRWDGGEQEVLMPQSYSPALHERFASDLLPYFSDERYIRVEGKPVLLVYRPEIIPDLKNTVVAWRQAWRNAGLGEVYLIAVESFKPLHPTQHGFDACAEFPPHQALFKSIRPDQAINLIADPAAQVFDYNKLAKAWVNRPVAQYKRFRGLLPGWDNSSRRRKGGATLFVNANSETYETWLTQTVAHTLEEFDGDERLVFINAWNEWAEGCILEPDQRHGRAYLEATRRVMQLPEPALRQMIEVNTDDKATPYHRWVMEGRIGPEHPLQPLFRLSEHAPLIDVAIASRGITQSLEKSLAAIHAQLRPAHQVLTLTPEDSASNLFDTASAPWTLLLCEGDALEPDALLLLERALDRHATDATRVLYFDHDEIDSQGVFSTPHLKPDFNHDLLLSYPYMGRALLVRTRWARTLVGPATRRCDLPLAYALALQALKESGAAGFVHLPAVIAHLTPEVATVFANTDEIWQSLAGLLTQHLSASSPGSQVMEGPAPGTFHCVYPLTRTPLVSIVIPTRDQLAFLSRCIETLLEKTDYPNFEILVVDNDSQTPEAQEYLSGLAQLAPERIRILPAPGAFNFSRMNNQAVAQARGEFILMLNNDTAVLQPDWLRQLVSHALREEVGIVGARLIYPDGRLQHAGVILGLRGPAEHPFLGLSPDESSYRYRAQVQQNLSAVTAACLLVSKALYQSVGGLDETTFGVSYNDVDFCLRVGQTGQRIVWTPLATLLHEGSASQKNSIESLSEIQKIARFTHEQTSMYERWPRLIANDPAYNPNSTLGGQGYFVEAIPLLRFDKLQGLTQHKVAAFPADEDGCGNYRVIQPMLAMLEAGLCTGGSTPVLSPNLVLRSGADTLIFQRPNTDTYLDILKALSSLKGIRKIYEADDNYARVPVKSAHHPQLSMDMRGRVAKAIGYCDRVVVSTQALAQELKGQNDDIRVVPNRLPPSMWGKTPPLRRASAQRERSIKPRIGWAGGDSHQGDLEMIADVMRDLADQVDWVFIGMCPEVIRPYVREFYAGVPTLDYPRLLKAQAQSWDLAIAPLEDNLFNECKSNLKLLEYGWCGVPVICSDVTSYQGELPATRVKNRYKDWRNAITERISELDSCQRDGQALQEQVARDWTLSGKNLQDWFEAWTH